MTVADLVIACGSGLTAQPDNLRSLLTSQLKLIQQSTQQSTQLSVQQDFQLSVQLIQLRPNRWAGYVRLDSAVPNSQVPSSQVSGSQVLARALVKRLRSKGHSAVLGPYDETQLRGFANRNRPTQVNDDLVICFPWASSDASEDAPFGAPLGVPHGAARGVTKDAAHGVSNAVSKIVNKVVEIDPGGSFGAGSHPSTVLAARELVPLLTGPLLAGPLLAGPLLAGPLLASPVSASPVSASPVSASPVSASPVLASSPGECDVADGVVGVAEGMRDVASSVLDVGSGSGVLALVAARCGAAKVVGVDIDPAAQPVAQRNAEINGLSHCASFETGQVFDAAQTFDVVVANIGANTLARLAPVLINRLAPAGRLILSGISLPQVSRLQAQLEKLGMVIASVHRLDDWCALSAHAPTPS